MIKIHKCKRCKHEWVGRLTRPPKVCPGCNSPYWNKPKWKGIDKTIEEDLSISDRDTYNYLKKNWSSWSTIAEGLIRVAYKLEIEKNSQNSRFVNPLYSDIYYMLIGFALENYYKGAIVQRLLISGETLEADKLDDILKKHDILGLFKDAGLTTNNELYKSYLDYLTECVLWRGRYPLPIKATDIGGSITYHPPKEGEKFHIVTGLKHAIPINIIHELIDQSKSNLEALKQKV
jgi:hypothetical protein